MLTHGRDQLETLASGCVLAAQPQVNDWMVDEWDMTESDVVAAIDVYDAVLDGGSEGIEALLLESGIDITELLFDPDHSREEITRSDICEYSAAGLMIADGSCSPDTMFMPNVPKMSRRKSDSGIDIIDVTLLSEDSDELVDGEAITVVSVKHTLQSTTASLRNALVRSVSPEEFTNPYLMSQLRVLNGNLQMEGVSEGAAARVYFFIRDFHRSESVEIVAVGVVPPDLKADFRQELQRLPQTASPIKSFRAIYFPALADVHERCG
jgi:hypothetical protein